MYVKIINPKTNGRVVYANTGSAQRCANYLVQEAKADGQEAAFFGAPERGTFSADEAVALLDANHKGVGKDGVKFHSLVLSPSADEVAQAGNDLTQLADYTQRVMEQYAQNFKLKNGQSLHESDLVWAATIHQERKHRGTDDGTQGERKDGLQTHIHVMVSARDAAQKITLNPLGEASRFNHVQFQAQAVTQFEEQFGPSRAPVIGTPARTTRAEKIANAAALRLSRKLRAIGAKKSP